MPHEALSKLANRQNLSSEETRALFDQIFLGKVPEETIRDLLVSFADKGETTDEILGAALSMRANMIPYPADSEAIDIVGTGGDKLGTLNISTAAALVVAACGVPVAKHGNRAASSLSGSSDVLAALGVNLEPPESVLNRCLSEAGIVFLFAPRHHPAMRHVAHVRKALGRRTIFNYLGPLTNPANVKKHLIGVSSKDFLLPMAQTLQKLGSAKAWLAHSQDGMDEITTTGPTTTLQMLPDSLHETEILPTSYGLKLALLDELKGGNAEHNAQMLRTMLGGMRNAYRDVVLLNSAAALVVADKVATIDKGLEMARAVIESGAALEKLLHLIRLTNEAA